MKSSNAIISAFDVYAAKKPVQYDSCQLKANQAYAFIEEYLTAKEKTDLHDAYIHIVDCKEDRSTFDAVCQKIRQSRGWFK